MKNLKVFSAVALFLGVLLISGCSELVPEKNGLEYGSVAINAGSRAVFVDEIKNAKVSVSGFNSSGEKFETPASEFSSVNDGKGILPVIEKIPVSKNVVVKVQAYSGADENLKIEGITLYAVCDINDGEQTNVDVNWESSKKGRVYAALIEKSFNTSTLTDEQISSINNAIPDANASLIDAAGIAGDFISGTLKEKNSYVQKAGSVKITANGCSGCTIQVSDPNSKVSAALSSDSEEITISDVAPGSWNVYAVKDGVAVKNGTVTVSSGGTSNVVLGNSSVEFDGIKILVAKSLGFPLVHYWNCSDKTAYPNTTWPGVEMSSSGEDYVYEFKEVSSVSLLITNSSKGKLCEKDIVLSSKGIYRITKDGAEKQTAPVPPAVAIPSTAYLGGTFSINVTSELPLIENTIYIGGFSKDVTVGKNSFNVADFTTSEGILAVSGTLSNSAGSTPVSGKISVTAKPENSLVSDWNELRIYQVMVSSFQDGDSSVGYGTGYGPGPHNGDLRGVINALDYIKSLGMNAIWLTPIFTSDGNNQLDSTGYFCSDYFNVDPKFGGNAVFAELVEEAHKLGINIILDGVFGHHRSTGVSKASPKGKYPSGGSNPVKYPDSLDYYKEVAQYWIENYKIDGWRFDQCYQVGLGDNGKNCNTGGHNYWYEIRTAIKESSAKNGVKGQDWGTLGYTVGEHWNGDAAQIQAGSVNPGSAGGYGLQSCFDFPSRYKIVQMFATEESKGVSGISLSNLEYVYSDYSKKGYTHPEGYYPNLFITNHDLVRFGNLINWKFSENRSSENYWKRHKIALASVAAYSGPITVYYGDEYGMMTDGYSNGMNGWYNDNIARDAGKISGFSSKEQDLHDYVSKLMKIRMENEVMWNGKSSTVTSSSNFYAGKKTLDGKTVCFGINNSSDIKSFSISGSGTDLISGEDFSGNVTVPALSARFILLD